ncbi:MAG TPA: PilZ domain-containing protein [Candidatus Goldiibacteriota bacterium]|nr:PilZ domain-containing protein [Candidatus Goldiibacteriota bacterium]HRQ44318.1 PilZ domain-containing protein [Candidatus Goldiibacteriota bacterium]
MADSELYIERRKFKRADKNIHVSYKVVSVPNEIDDIKRQASRKVTESANISIGGIQLLDESELVPAQILRLEFTVEGRKETIVTFAEVRWVAKDSNIKKYRIGIEFLVLKDEDKKMIAELVG